MEIWKDIDGFENYQISNNGNVRKGQKRIGTRVNCRGYLSVELWKNGKRYRKTVHRLVAESFIPNPFGYIEVNHINEDKTDSRAENLEWCNHYHNMMHGTRNKRISKANSKKVNQIKDGKILKTWQSTREAEKNGYNHRSISLCCRGIASHHKGFKWEYAN